MRSRAKDGLTSNSKDLENLACLKNQIKVLRLVAAKRPLDESLTALCDFVEKQIPGSVCSVLTLDGTGTAIGRSIAPHLPRSYSENLIGVKIGPKVGSCGAAMALNKPIIVNDIASHPNWVDFKAPALSCGLRACWSYPFSDSTATVRGAFAIYSDSPRSPCAYEKVILAVAGEIAAIAIELSQVQADLYFRANYDQLTALLNRHALFSRLKHIVKSHSRRRTKFAVLLLDLDRFKHLNDTYGHLGGDAILKEVGNRLQHCVRSSDVVARLGGDEFAVVLDGINNLAEAENIAQKILQVIAYPLKLEDQQLNLTASMGVTTFPDDATTVKQLIGNADQALYSAKDNGRNQYACFSRSMQPKACARPGLPNDARSAA